MSDSAEPPPSDPATVPDQFANWRLAAIVASSSDAIVSKRLDGTITSWNRAAEIMFGYPAEEAVGQSILLIIPEDRRGEETEIISRIRRGETVPTLETIRQRKDGSLFPVSLTVSPILDDAGRIVGASKIARDISEAKKNEQRIRLLLREVHHRVKNNLQTIASLVQLQDLPDEAKKELRGRIMTIAAVHEHLHRPDSNGEVNLGEYLGELITSVNDSFGGRVSLELELDPVLVEADLATTIGLVANELIYNANKYAFPDSRAGKFGARLARVEGRAASLRLYNDGVPFDPRAAHGIGIRLIRGLVETIDRDYVFEGHEGLNFVVRLPTVD